MMDEDEFITWILKTRAKYSHETASLVRANADGSAVRERSTRFRVNFPIFTRFAPNERGNLIARRWDSTVRRGIIDWDCRSSCPTARPRLASTSWVINRPHGVVTTFQWT